MSDVTLKKCTQCGIEKPYTAEYFPRRKGGLYAECRVCNRERNRQWKAEHAEHVKQYKEQYNASHRDEQRQYRRRYYEQNAERQREYARQYAAEHPEAVKKTQRRWYLTHQEEALANARRYRTEHGDKVRETNQRCYKKHADARREYQRRLRIENPQAVKEVQQRYSKNHPEANRANQHRRRLKHNGEHFTAKDVALQIKAQTDKRGGLHCWWCGKVIESSYHIDHVIPLSRGGTNNAANIVIAHAKCNSEKYNKTPAEFMGRLL